MTSTLPFFDYCDIAQLFGGCLLSLAYFDWLDAVVLVFVNKFLDPELITPSKPSIPDMRLDFGEAGTTIFLKGFDLKTPGLISTKFILFAGLVKVGAMKTLLTYF